MGIGRLERLNVKVACFAAGQNSTARGLAGLSKQKPRPLWGNQASTCVFVWYHLVVHALSRQSWKGLAFSSQNPGHDEEIGQEAKPQSDLRSWWATNKKARKSQRGKYQERNSSTGITHELHCVCTKWLNQMTQGRASSATNRPKSDLLGSKSEEIQMKNTHGTLWLFLLIFLNSTGLQTEIYCCRNYTVVDVSLSRPGARQARLFSEFPYLKPIIKVWHQYLGGCLKYL